MMGEGLKRATAAARATTWKPYHLSAKRGGQFSYAVVRRRDDAVIGYVDRAHGHGESFWRVFNVARCLLTERSLRVDAAATLWDACGNSPRLPREGDS